MSLFDFFRDFLSAAVAWCKGRLWWPRVFFLLWFFYVLVRHTANPEYASILSLLNLGIHEVGHLIFGVFGEFLGIAGGTMFQCFVPIFSVYNFYRQGDFFAIALSFGWLGTSLFDMARYVGDARAMSLPLLSPFGGGSDIIHDWNYLLSKLGILRYDIVFAWLLKTAAVALILVCLSFGAWLLWQMAVSKPE